MNRVALIGTLVRDIELKETSNGSKYTRFSIAVSRNFKNEDGEYTTDFFNIVAWRKTAEFISNYFHKGSRIAIAGKLQQEVYDDKDGNHRSNIVVVAEDVFIIDKKNKEEQVEKKEEPKEEDPMSDDVFKNFGDSIEISEDDVAF